MKKFIVGPAALSLLAGCALLDELLGRRQVVHQIPCGAELVVNGSFEEDHQRFAPDGTGKFSFMSLDATSTELTGWSISGNGNKLAWLRNDTEFPYKTPPSNDPNLHLIDLTGALPKEPFPALSQEITLPAAGWYQLSFDVG